MQSVVYCIVVGDGFVGKFCFVQKIVGGKFYQEYVVILKDNYFIKLFLNGDSFEMNIMDIVGEVRVFFQNSIYLFMNFIFFCKIFLFVWVNMF